MNVLMIIAFGLNIPFQVSVDCAFLFGGRTSVGSVLWIGDVTILRCTGDNHLASLMNLVFHHNLLDHPK